MSSIDKNSVGPLGQLLEIINKFVKAASTITNPTSSHKELKMKASPFLKYLKTFPMSN